MAESIQYVFEHREVVTALLKQQGIHEGTWMLAVNFAFGAANIGQSPDGSDAMPAAIVTIAKLGLQQTDTPTSLSVDAAVANPR